MMSERSGVSVKTILCSSTKLLDLYCHMQVSYISSGTVLTNVDIFPNLIQVHSPERNNMPGLAETVKLFNWTRLVILSEDNVFFTTV